MTVTDYEVVVGLEVHVELATKSKIFCGCSTAFGAEPNTQTCPVCLGHPGVLPVLNEEALEFAVQAALALSCEIAPYAKFDRKNYVYPDLPKAYQISQYDLPLARNGWVEFTLNGETRRVRIRRVHLEEDAGKLLHAGDDIALAGASLVDFNRCGVPLIEIVSEPDLRSAEEARLYLEKLKSIIQYTGVSDVKMEEGSLRCDVNVSVRPAGSNHFGTRTEAKNLNSFRAAVRAIEYEAKRQIQVLSTGGTVEQETRTWSEARGITLPLRSKEEAHDYRYFPEPDLPPVVCSPEYVEKVRRSLPTLPDERKAQLVAAGLSAYDAEQITASRRIADYFDETVALYKGPDAAKTVANWVINDLMRVMNARGLDDAQIPVTAANLVALLELIDKGTISGKIARTVFDEMAETGRDPGAIVQEKGLVQIAHTGELQRIAHEAVAASPGAVAEYARGKDAAANFIVGAVMKATKGRANPDLARKLVLERLKELTGRG